MTKTPSMEAGRISSHNNLETATLLENLGGCCEGTVFTFTSAGSKWRLRQRLNRNKASLLNPHGGRQFREDPADSVFTEMRMMPRSSETNSNGVDMWNRTKWSTSNRIEGRSRANNTTYHDTGDLRCYRRISKLSGQIGGDQWVKAVPQEVVKADHERNELQVFKEDTTQRKNRRYLRCDHFTEGHKDRDIGVDDKTWIWNEKKLEEVRAQEEQRRNKRESCTEEIYVFEQRKVKCRRREQDSCSSRSESMRSEDLSKADDVRRASYGFNNRQGAAEEPKKQQLGHSLAISTYVADESTKNRRGPLMEAAEEIGDRCSNYLPKQKSLSLFHDKRGNAREENRRCITPRPEIESPSTPPMACSFISFKAGVPYVRSRRFHVPGEASLRPRTFSDVEYGATVNCVRHETQSQILSNNRLFEERSSNALSVPSNKLERTLELSLQSINAEMEGCDSPTKIGRSEKPEALEDLHSMGREMERMFVSELVTAHSSHKVGQGVLFHQKPIGTPQELQWSVRITDLNTGSDVVSSFDLRGPHKTSWERSPSRISKSKPASVNEVESGAQRINISHLQPHRVTEGSRDRLSSRPLDSYGSYEVEDDLQMTNTGCNDQRSNDRDSDDEFTSRRGTDEPSPVQERVESRDDISEFSLDGINNPQSAEVKDCEPCDVPTKYVDDGNADIEDKAPSAIANDSLRKSRTLELEKQRFRGAETDIPDGKQSINSSCSSMPEKFTETVDVDKLPQKSVPLRRQAWVKGLKRKTRERVGYFDYWLGRGKKDLSSRKPNKISPGRKCGPNGVGELSQASQADEPKLDDEHDKSRPLGNSIDQPIISQAWSKKESQAYVTREFEILEAVLQSEVPIDDGHSEVADYSQQTSRKSSAVVGIVDKRDGSGQEQGTRTGQANSQAPDSIDINTVTTNSEAGDDLAHVRCTVGQDSSFHCGEQESSHVAGLSNNNVGQAKECRQTMEEREDPLMRRKSSADDLNAVLDRHSLKPQDVHDSSVMSEEGFKNSLTRSTDMEVFSQSQGTPPCSSDVQRLGIAEQYRFLFEKRCKSQENKLTGAHVKVSEGMMKPVPHLTVLNDSRDIPTHNVLDRSDVAVGERSMPDKFETLAIRRSSVQELRSPKSKSSQVMVGYQGNGECTDENFPNPEDTLELRNGLTESETAGNGVGPERSSAAFRSEIDVDKFPSSLKVPTGKEVFEPEKTKESSLNRRHKMPIIVRVRNRLASGWLLQPSLWKRVGKQKMKTGESQVLTTKGTNQKEIHADPSSLSSEQGSTLHESRTENVINTNPASRHDTELTFTRIPQIFKLEARHRANAAAKKENVHRSSSGDLDPCKNYRRIDDIEYKPAASETYAVGEQNEVSRTPSPPAANYDVVEKDYVTNDDRPDQESPVVSFAEWQSRATGFRNSSPSKNKLGANLVVNDINYRETKPQKSNELKNVGELLSAVCLGNSVKEATVLKTFSEFDPGGQGQRDRQVSDGDRCDELIREVCPSEREKVTTVSQKSSACTANGPIINSNSEAMKSSFCHREAHSEAEVHKKKQTYIPMDSPANTCLNCCSGVGEEGAGTQESQEYERMQKFSPLNDQNEDLHTCFSASLDHGCEGSPPSRHGRVHTPSHTADSIGEQPQVDGQSDNKYFTPQAEDLLDYLSADATLDESARPASGQRQPRLGTADEEQHRHLPNCGQPFEQATVVDPFCLPLQVANSGKELVLGDGPEKGREVEEHRRSSPNVKGMKEEDQSTACCYCSLADKSPGDLKQWELIEMLKMPNHQKQLLPGHKPKILSSKDNQEHVYRTEKQTNAWESSYQKDCCGGTRGTLCWKDVPKNHSAKDRSTEEQVFLERFSATSSDLKPCKLPPQSYSSHFGVESLRQSCRPSSPDLSTQMRLLSAPARLNCGRTESLSLGRNVELAPLASDAHLINSLPPCASTRSSSCEARAPDSSEEYKHERYNAFESRLLPDYAPSLDGLSPSSSINRSLDLSERLFTKARPCADCANKYEHREAACVEGGADGVHDWKSSETEEFLPSLTMHGSTFPAQCLSLLWNPRQSPCPIHTSQSGTQCRCDPCNISCRYSPPFLLRCHHPSGVAAVQHPSHCRFPRHSHPLPVAFYEPGMFQKTSAPDLHGPNVQYPRKDTLHSYSPMQVIQPSATPRPRSRGDSQQPLLPHERPCADKNRTQNYQLGGQSKSNQTKGTESEKGLVLLSEQEMNLIQQLRLSSEKAAGVCRHDAAAVIQRNWRKYIEKRAEENLKVECGQQAAALSLLTEYPMWHDHFQHCKLLPAAMSLQLLGSSPKDLSHRNLVKRWYTTMQKAASVIQRAWRSVLRNRKETLLTRREWPKDLKGASHEEARILMAIASSSKHFAFDCETFYDIIKFRLVTRGHEAPSFGLFTKSVKRIQAATEGARVRRRLKSHRLQTIVLEIKEIRMLLYEMSQEEKSTSTRFLFPQLCTQLQQKISQLHAALNGKQMEARYLLRRCAATPLTIHSSRSTSPKSVSTVPSQKSLNQSLAKLSSGAVGARKFYSPPLTNPASAVSTDQKFIQTQSFVPLMQGLKGNAIRLRNSSPDPPDIADPPDSAKLLQLYFLAPRSPSKSIGGRGTPDSDVTSGHEPNVKKVVETNEDPSQKWFSSQNAFPKWKDPENSLNKTFDEQPLPVPQRRKIPEMSLEEMASGWSNANMYLTEYAPSTDLTDKPKRPFLKRKSIAMPSQKLDWSKVKPMVSSRLEPELKTKLSFCKGPTKEPAKVTSKKKKANYSNVKSRLFSYEENVSPSNSGDGTYLRSHTTETSDSGYPPMLRGSARGSSIEGTENGRYSRAPANRQRTVSPDLMHLRRSMAEADRLCSQNSMGEARNVATYNSNFDSARYFHKLGHNSEQTSKGSLTGSRQQRTQRSIRLRILPGSKESPVGDLFVQEEMQEIWEDRSHSPADGKGKREQGHSHRYAIYQEQDGRHSSRVAEATRPGSAKEDRQVTATSSRKDIQHMNYTSTLKQSES